MANPERLKILKQGVKAWNKWRNENPEIKPDLKEAILGAAHRSYIELGPDFVQGYVGGAYYGGADLCKGDLHSTDLGGASLGGVNLTDADLSSANLTRADLRYAYLVRTNLSRAKFCEADLSSACLEQADLSDADLRFCCLVQTKMSRAILTGAKLYGTARDNWAIKNVQCKYVYWDVEGKQRSPKDRDLEPGEFERLYSALPTIEYIFEDGMSPLDPLIMDRVVQAIREKRPEFDIKIDSINARGLAPSVKFTVQHADHKELALEEVRKGYEIKLKQLESERDRYWEVIKAAFDKPREVKLITAGPGAIVATDGSTVNIQQHVHNALDLQKAIAKEPAESKTFAKIAKNKALDIIGKALEDIAKGQIKEAAKQIIQLGKDLGPIFVRMAPAAYEFFKNMIT